MNHKQQLFDLWAPHYDWLFPSVVYQAIHKRLLEYVNLPQQCDVLDLGCGTGRLLNTSATQFPLLRGIGLDFSFEMIHQARCRNCHHPRLIYVVGNAESLPFANGQFDAVFSTLSFLHYPNPEQVFAEVSRVLRERGHFYLVDITSSKSDRAVFPGDIKLYSPRLRERLGRQVELNTVTHHYLLGSVLLTIFTKI